MLDLYLQNSQETTFKKHIEMLKVLFHLEEKSIKLNDTFRVSTGWVLVTQLCPALFGPMDYSPPGSSVCGILQAKMLEWIANLSATPLFAS